MPSLLMPLLTVLAAAIVYVVYHIAETFIIPLRSPLRHLPGPPNPSIIWGNMKKLTGSVDNAALSEEWMEQYGPAVVYQDPLNANRLLTMDLKAISHVINHPDVYQKSKVTRKTLAHIIGQGLISAEGEQHKRQRRVLNPAFGPAQIRNLSGIFLLKANQLSELWQTQFTTSRKDIVTVDVFSWLSKATLDIIGLAGFGYEFDALTAQPESSNELNTAFQSLFRAGTKIGPWSILRHIIPALSLIPTKRQKTLGEAKLIMDKIGRRLLSEKKASVFVSAERLGKSAIKDRDLLSILVRANIATDLPHSQRLTDDEVLAQIPTFISAGHETTSNAVAWTLHALSLAPAFQARLRAELQTLSLPNLPSDEPLSSDILAALNALPLLDATIRESLRLWPPVSSVVRVAEKEDIIPFEKPVVDRYGKSRNSIKLQKGDGAVLNILALNRSKEIWGDDSHVFNPDRWLGDTPSSATAVPGVWSHLMTFIGGSRACIGYRFSILESKILLHALVKTFAFRPAVHDIVRKSFGVDRPYVRSQLDQGPQLPLIIERID